jgi:hypothetical protein
VRTGVHAASGNILILETDRPFARGFRRGLEELVVKADRTALLEVPQLGRPIITSSPDNGSNGLYSGHWLESPAGPPEPIGLW